jgi:hypothetical protein
MATIEDDGRTYSARWYSDITDKRGYQKVVTLEGQEKKQIKITKFSMLQFQGTAGTTGTAVITVKPDGGEEETLATVIETKTSPQSKEIDVNYLAPEGVGVTVTWYLYNSVDTSRSYIRKVTAEYDYVQVEEVPVVSAYLLIPCKDEAEAEEIKGKISGLVTDLKILVNAKNK